ASIVLVTTFQAARPLLMRSIEENVRATLYGSLKLVETVAPRPILLVTRDKPASKVVGSKRVMNDGCRSSCIATASPTNNTSNLARSASCAPASTNDHSLLLKSAFGIRHPAEWFPVPSQNTARCIWRLLVMCSYPVAARTYRITNDSSRPAEILAQTW